MRQAADTSLVLAALLEDHPAHEPASEALASCTTTISHVLTETYSVLTRLPAPHRIETTKAATVIGGRLPSTYLTLQANDYADAPKRLAAVGIGGGATYDGLIALTALAHELELLSRDTRAARTYRALGASFRLLA